jgi:hypothetical protein
MNRAYHETDPARAAAARLPGARTQHERTRARLLSLIREREQPRTRSE